MPCEVQHALAATLAIQKILVTLEDHNFLDILARVLRKVCKLRRHPPQIPHHAATYSVTPRGIPFWKRQAQIELYGAPQLRLHRIQEPCDYGREASCQAARKGSQHFEYRPYRGVLQS